MEKAPIVGRKKKRRMTKSNIDELSYNGNGMVGRSKRPG